MSVPAKVGIILFIICLVLGVDMKKSLIIVGSHYLLHKFL